MTNKTKGIIALSFISITSIAFAASHISFNNNFGIKKAGAVVVDFDTATITRRFYFVLNGYNDCWDWKRANTPDTFTVRAYDGVLTQTYTSATATRIYNDFGDDNMGLWYADITAKGIGSSVKVQIKSSNSNNAWAYSAEQTLNSLGDKVADIIWVNSGANGSGNRNSSVGSAFTNGDTGKVATFISAVSHCTDGYNNGYNAYPQINANFISPNQKAVDDYGAGTDCPDKDAEQNVYKLSYKLSCLQTAYETYGWTVPEIS